MTGSKAGTILIVDDTPANLTVLLDFLRREGYEVIVAGNGARALERAATASPELILLDIMMPEMDGYEVCRRLKESETLRDIPVIFMTALSETRAKLKGFEAGAADYITKPFEAVEVLARIRTHLRLYRMQRQLEEKQRELETLATTDPLTGLFNRRRFLEHLGNSNHCLNRYGTPFALIMLDIDHFKEVNDRFGHSAGDAVLRSLAGQLRQSLRESDIAARWGGEEFIVLTQNTGLEEALNLAERLRRLIAEQTEGEGGVPSGVTASFGVTSGLCGEAPDDALRRVDDALYDAKRAGRNCVRCLAEGDTVSHFGLPALEGGERAG